MSENLKKETAKGVAWSAVDRFANTGIQLLANVVLARLLSPDDFGLIAMIAIFIQIAQVFIDSGFTNALIQKKDRNQVDYSTVFYFNLGISIILYILLFFSAPYIAMFFDSPKLESLTRVVGINLIIGALVAVHRTKLTIELKFKHQSLITLVAASISATISIIMAYKGFGVWSLVIMSLLNIFIQTILFYSWIRWMPSLIFSKQSFRHLFSYSSKILGASIIHLLYRNLYPIAIGKRYAATELGYYNRADTFSMYPATIMSSVVSRVAFPVFSKIQDDNDKLRHAYRKYIKFASIFIFPIMLGIIALAKPFTIVVLTEKWLPMVTMLQILCVDWAADHINQINLNILFVKGRSDLALKLEIIKKSIAVIILFISLLGDIIWVCWGRVIYGIIALFINTHYTKKLIGISRLDQVKDFLIPLVASVMMCICVLLLNYFIISPIIQFCVGIVFGIIIYVLFTIILMPSEVRELRSIARSTFFNK